MKCPHCQVAIHAKFVDVPLATATGLGMALPLGKENSHPTFFTARCMECPECHKAIIFLRKQLRHQPDKLFYAYPKKVLRPAAPLTVPASISEDFNEAAAVMEDSPKASAALTRRCVQAVLHSAGYTHHDLSKAIAAALASKTLPASLASNLDAVREIGNFAAHPIKDSNTGEILPVEPHEAEWNLEVCEALFDFYYVQPAANEARLTKFKEKVATAGRKPLQEPPAEGTLEPDDTD